MQARVVITALTGALAVPCLAARPGISFEHKDWELACDNTGTCRAAGYQVDDDGPAVSVLLVRAAGPRQEPTAQVQLGDNAGEGGSWAGGVTSLALKVDGRTLGTVAIDPARQTGTLPRATLAALLPALQSASVIEWVSNKHVWQLSTAGASAVLLKMDETQGRIGTVGAIVRKGSQPEDSVQKPAAPPVVVAAAVPKASEKDMLLAPSEQPALLAELRRTVSRDDCPGLYEDQEGKMDYPLVLHRLSSMKVLVWAHCANYAYNEASGFWVINARRPFSPVVAANLSAIDYQDGTITSMQKGRGVADCVSSATWVWTGAEFVQTSIKTSGMCRSLAVGGGWNLPTWVTTVRKGAAVK